MQGTSVTLGAGDFGTLYGNVTHAGANERYGYKVSGGYYEQDPFDRPTGDHPRDRRPDQSGRHALPALPEPGTTQPKANVRFDFDQNVDSTWGFDVGYAATDGIMHSGIGPFDIASGASMSYVKVDWNKRAARATFFVNLLDGDASNLLSRGLDGQPIQFAFASDTYNLDFSNTQVVGSNNIFTYGATARKNEFDLSIAPAGDSRDEYGVFVQDEILIGDKARWLIGARWDDIDPIGSVVSPRTSLLISPNPHHTFRVSFNRAFRAPSMINNFLDVTIINEVGPLAPRPCRRASRSIPNDVLAGLVAAGLVPPGVPCQFVLTTCTPFFYNIFPVERGGQPAGDRGEARRVRDRLRGTVRQRQPPSPSRSIATRRPTPSTSTRRRPTPRPTRRSTGRSGCSPRRLRSSRRSSTACCRRSSATATSARSSTRASRSRSTAGPARTLSWFLNYSYQAEPETTGIDQETLPNGTVRNPINSPPQNRVNAGFSFSGERYFFNANANYQDEAFWTDVLDSRFWGPTDAFTQVNLSAGVRFGERPDDAVGQRPERLRRGRPAARLRRHHRAQDHRADPLPLLEPPTKTAAAHAAGAYGPGASCPPSAPAPCRPPAQGANAGRTS